ncbi:MAG: hypothetical protein DMG89_06760 [Acidobacteria bacterium]|nr:MAG: hypothetical protein DMG89_06760 [Acidobacteriota bacterium]
MFESFVLRRIERVTISPTNSGATTEHPANAPSPPAFVVTSQTGGVEVIDRIAEAWRALCSESSNDEPFYHPEWIAAHIRAFFPGATVVVITASLNRKLRMVLPLLKDNALICGVPLRRLRSPVNSHSGRFDLVRPGGEEGNAAVAAVCGYLAALPGCDLLQFDEVPESGVLETLIELARTSGLNTAKVPMRPNPYVSLPSTPDLLKQLPRNARLRTKLRQVRRELAEKGTLHLRRIETADQKALQRFYELEAKGWKGRERSAIACNTKTRQFYDEVADTAARYGYLSLYMLEFNNELLAAHFGLSHRGHYYSPKVAHDEQRRDWAPGHLLVSEILQDCCGRGIEGYDILGPNDDWKMKWTAETRRKNTYFIFRKGLRSKLAYSIRFKLRPLAISWVRSRRRPQ